MEAMLCEVGCAKCHMQRTSRSHLRRPLAVLINVCAPSPGARRVACTSDAAPQTLSTGHGTAGGNMNGCDLHALPGRKMARD